MKLYQHLAHLQQARINCEASGNDFGVKHREAISQLVKEHMPSGSGFDNGTTFDPDSTGEKLIFNTSFHHMNDACFYDGWTDHKVTVTPSLLFGINLSISGRNRNDIKEYIHIMFQNALGEEVKT